MDHRSRLRLAALATLGLFLVIQLGALALVEPFDAAGMNPVDDPDDPTNPLLYILAIFIATGLMLLAFKYELKSVVRAGVILACVMLAWWGLVVVVPPIVTVGEFNLLAASLAILVGIGLFVHPEWYIIDLAGVLIGATAAGLFGLAFGILPAIVLLTVLAIYDAISVYGTKHMLSLADGVMDIRLPVILVIPITRTYSFLASPSEDEDSTLGADPAERDALFIGLGDAVIPAVLVASAAVYADATTLSVPVISLNVPALTAMIGTLVGLSILLRMVLKGRPHAGLPLLCGGAIVGYLIGAVLVGIPPLEAIGLAPYFS